MQEIENGVEQISSASQIVETHASETNGIFTSILESNKGSLVNVKVISTAAQDQYTSTESLKQVIHEVQIMADELNLLVKKSTPKKHSIIENRSVSSNDFLLPINININICKKITNLII